MKQLDHLVTIAMLWVMLTPALSYAQDSDGDGLSDAEELIAGSNPGLVDTDADGLGDGAEVLRWGTNPNLADSDNGGDWDLAEIFAAGTDPTNGADDTTWVGGEGAYHYWCDVTADVKDYGKAETALAQAVYVDIRAFRWGLPTDLQRNEIGDFTQNTPFNGVFGGNRDGFAGVVHGWLFIPPVATATNQWSIAVGSSDGWDFMGWTGTQNIGFNHDGGGFRAEHHVFDFPVQGGIFPFEIVTWEDVNEEAFEWSWAAGDVDYDNGIGYSLVPPSVVLASNLVATQQLVDVNGGVVAEGDMIDVYVRVTNTGQAAAYNLQFQPAGSGISFDSYGPMPDGWLVAGDALTIPIIDADTTFDFRYRVILGVGPQFTAQAEIRADAFPNLYGIGGGRIRVLTDDPTLIGPIDTGNLPVGFFIDGASDDDRNSISVGSTIESDQCGLSLDDCDINASCTNTATSWTCTCDPGYTGSGQVCTDVDECASGSAGCAAAAICTNVPGSFGCACAPGYLGDGFTCVDVDECLLTPCDPDAACSNSAGSFSCTCNAGFIGDGLACADLDECANNTAGCDTNAVCANFIGGFDCACNVGFRGDGRNCTDIDECAEAAHDCDPVATCTNQPGGFECACPDGYDGDGRSCTLAACPCTTDEVCAGGECFQSCIASTDCDDPADLCYASRCTDDPCEGVQCAPQEACVGGGCFATCGESVDCSDPSDLCFDSRCAPDACTDIVCPAEQTCWGGGCFDTCGSDVDCTSSVDRCYETRCADDPCRDVTCATGRSCYGGGCFDMCGADVDCEAASDICFESRCAVDACAGVQCPSSETCAAGYCRALCVSDSDCDVGDICNRGICGVAQNVPQEKCGCASPGEGASNAWLGLLMLAGIRFRRRRGRA